MGKTSTKLAVYASVQLLLFHLSGLVATVDLIFYEDVDDCVGSGIVFANVDANTCCPVEIAGSVASIGDTVGETAFYEGGDCSDLVFTWRGNVCAVGGDYTGATWSPLDSKSLLADGAQTHESSNACNAQTKPTGIVYSEDSMKGHWILTTDNATEMYTQMGSISYAQKVDWLQAHGAILKPNSYLGPEPWTVVAHLVS